MKSATLCSAFALAALALMAATPAKAEETATASAAASPLLPAMIGPLGLNTSPHGFDASIAGKVYVGGALTGTGLVQNRPASSNDHGHGDLSNGLITIQNTGSPVQFFVAAGGYSLPTVGTPYLSARKTTAETYGYIPEGFIKIAPAGTGFSLSAGKLASLIGPEYMFSFQNPNIEHSLLFNQTNTINRGLQADYTTGPLSLSLSWNDGFYSNKYNWVTGAATYKIADGDSVTLSGGTNFSDNNKATTATPLAQNNSEIANLAYTHVDGGLTLTPSLQYTRVPENASIGINHTASAYGAQLMAKYSFDANYSLGARAEIIDTKGNATGPNLLYGANSRAWSLTLTPTYQYDMLFARLEGSYVRATKITSGSALGPSGDDKSQGRLMLEAGILF